MNRSQRDEKILSFPKLVTKGARLSPSEDFRVRTLSALSGVWSKLLYMAELRSRKGNYDHWGHMRTHGEKRSQVALAEVHTEIYLELLRTPLRHLTQESSAENQINWGGSIEQVKNKASQMVPGNPGGGSPRHFNSIVLAVCLLDADRQACRRSSA
jgi:hypothetical protein